MKDEIDLVQDLLMVLGGMVQGQGMKIGIWMFGSLFDIE